MVCFLVFAHSTVHSFEDIQDMIDNISYFHDDCDFVVNHPLVNHAKVRTRHLVGPPSRSSCVFGVFIDMVKSLSEDEIKKFDHFCLVSANQYFINKIHFEKGKNYFQFYNSPNWDSTYTGVNTPKGEGNFLQQPYGKWDPNDLYKDFGIENPMASNWECGTLTTESMLLCKQNIDRATEVYPNQDLMSIFPGYMALLSKQQWDWPLYFGTYDPSNTNRPKNWIINIDQVNAARNAGLFSIKRTNYSRNCPIKSFIRNNYMKG